MPDAPGSIPVFPVAETRFGRMFTLRGDTVIGRSLRLYGEFAGDEVDSIRAFLRPGDHVLDLGANIGAHSLAFADAVGPTGAVISVEPQRHCFQLLCANVVLNQLTTVQCLRAAVGDAPGRCAIPLLDPLARHNFGATEVQTAPESAQAFDTVDMISVDGLALSRCDLIKVDTEGYEDRVIAGARATLAAHLPVLYIEVHSRERLLALVGALRPLGYALWLHTTLFYREGNAMGEGAAIFTPNAGGTALVALPPGRALPEGLPGKLQAIG